jgi:hypothetical protein
MPCGCTPQQPACDEGHALFDAYVRAGRDLHLSRGSAREQAWDNYYTHRIAYHDHLHGWRQGDVRVRIEGEDWIVERHDLEDWVLSFTMSVPAILHACLRAQGLWRYAQLEEDQTRDRLTGYYHQRAAPLIEHITTAHLPRVQLYRWRYLAFQQMVDPLLDATGGEHDLQWLVTHLVFHLRDQQLDPLHLQRRVLGALMAAGVDLTRIPLSTLTRSIDIAYKRYGNG